MSTASFEYDQEADISPCENVRSVLDQSSLFGVAGQIVVITGGGTGIGLMMAIALEHNGATVYIVGRRMDVLERAARENNVESILHVPETLSHIISLLKRFGNLIPRACDVNSRESLLDLVESIKSRHGYINMLINNAGIARGVFSDSPPTADSNSPTVGTDYVKALQDRLWNACSPEEFTKVFETNVTAAYYTTIAFLELLHLGNQRATASKFSGISVDLGSRSGGAFDRLSSPPFGTPSTSSSCSPSFSSSPLPSSPPSSIHSPMNHHEARSGYFNPMPTGPSSQVITISSSGGFRRDDKVFSVPYTLSKAASTHLGKMLSNILMGTGIRSNVIAPGFFPSEMTQPLLPPDLQTLASPTDCPTQDFFLPLPASSVPLQRSGNIEDIGGLILFLASRAGAYVNGGVHIVDGGRLMLFSSTF